MYSCDRHGDIIMYNEVSCPYCDLEIEDIYDLVEENEELKEENEELKAKNEELKDTMDELKNIINN